MTQKSRLWLLFLLYLPVLGAHAGSITWSVENRFRAFDYLGPANIGSAGTYDKQKAKAAFDSLTPDGEKTTFDVMSTLVIARRSPWDEATPGPWIEDSDGINPRYASDFARPPRTVPVLAKLSSELQSTLGSSSCTWKVGATNLVTPCNTEVEIEVTQPTDVEVLDANGKTVGDARIAPGFKVILGLGDSYAAGEGSPDRPTIWMSQLTSYRKWQDGNSRLVNSVAHFPAYWQSERCNRSFYSQQNLVAMQLAIQDPHSIVAFVHLACAGAEVIDGLLAPQRHVPGHHIGCPSFDSQTVDPSNNDEDAKPNPRCDAPLSQISAAVTALCDVPPVPVDPAFQQAIRSGLSGLAYAPKEPAMINELVTCPRGHMLEPDLILLSIGGNDMGFGGVISWALALNPNAVNPRYGALERMIVNLIRTKGDVVCPTRKLEKGCEKELSAQDRIAELPKRFAALDMALTQLLNPSGHPTLHTTYPNPLRDSAGKLCSNKPGSTLDNEWDATRILIPALAQIKRWPINITTWEAEQIETVVIPNLNEAIRSHAKVATSWYVGDASHALDGGGWCVGPNRALLPPKKIEDWLPYADNGRLIQTANDSFMTQWPSTDDTYAHQIHENGMYGTFHPNPYGYRKIGSSAIKGIPGL